MEGKSLSFDQPSSVSAVDQGSSSVDDISVGTSQRCHTFTEKLQKRDDERQARIEQRRHEGSEMKAAEESVGYFWSEFNSSKLSIEEMLDATPHLVDALKNQSFQGLDLSEARGSSSRPNNLGMCQPPSVAEHFETISDHLQELHRLVVQSAIFLPSYDLRRAQTIISELENSFAKHQKDVQPRKKFSFKHKNTDYGAETASAPTDKSSSCPIIDSSHALVDDILIAETPTDLPGRSLMSSVNPGSRNECGFFDKTSLLLSMQPDEINRRDVSLSRLVQCEVRLFGHPSTVHISGLRDCRILSGPICTSAFISDCSGCSFVLACQQLRMHSTNNSDIYLHVTSRAIIEDCTKIQFAPYNWDYAELPEHFLAAGMKREENHWNLVDDFNWLSSDKPSPNWSILPKEKQIKLWE